MAKVRIYQKPAGIPANTSVFAVEILQNNIRYTRKVSWETLKGLIAGAESLVFNNGTLTFTTPDGVAHQVLSVDSEVTPNSANPVSSGAVSTALASKQDTLTFDQVPTDGSTNPVESNGIYDALAGKQDTLTFDTTPTDGSTNPVTSAGIYAAISAITTGIDWKEAVATYADIATTYPNPQDGWTVTTLDDDHTYRYTGTEWVDMFSLITQATAEKDGLMSAADFTKLAGIEAQANKTVVSDTLTPSTTTKKLATVSGGGSSTDILGDDADKILRAAFGEHTATGNPVSFDAFLGLEVVSECKVTMNPIQDLHGYEYPWVGGAGKNKLPEEFTDGYYWGSNGEQVSNEYCKISDFAKVSPNTTYTYSGTDLHKGSESQNAYVQVCFYNASKTFITRNKNVQSGNVTFTTTAETEYIRVSAGILADDLQIELGSTATEYAPYENICPISGRDSVTVTRTGKNLIDVADRTITSQTTIATGISLKAGTYTASIQAKNNTNIVGYFRLNSGGAISITQITIPSGANTRLSSTFTLDEDTTFNVICNGQSTGYNYTVSDIMIEEGSTATDYEPYTAETHTRTYSSTVYGGVDDFVSGEGSSTMGVADLGTLNWTFDSANNRFQSVDLTTTAKGNATTVMPNMLCECYPVFKASDTATTTLGITLFISGQYVYLRVIDANYSTLADFETAVTGEKVCYELATPTTITNTPEDVTLLKGVNVVSTDGDNLSVTYSADIKAYIDSKLNA